MFVWFPPHLLSDLSIDLVQTRACPIEDAAVSLLAPSATTTTTTITAAASSVVVADVTSVVSNAAKRIVEISLIIMVILVPLPLPLALVLVVVVVATACRNASFLSAFPMFVPSLSW
eukprot:COSAG06_NODE_1021_length_11055_cov_7.993976_14_plen_117_part_00